MSCSRRMDLALIALSIFSPAVFADGSVVLDLDGDSNDAREYHLIVGSDDRIYVSGCTVVALEKDGSLLSTFGAGGKLADGGGCDTHLLAGSAGSYFTVIRRLVAFSNRRVVAAVVAAAAEGVQGCRAYWRY